MDFQIEIISEKEYKNLYNKKVAKSRKSRSSYKPMTAKQREQRDADLAYYRNWKNSIRLPRAKSQRIADLNNNYYN